MATDSSPRASAVASPFDSEFLKKLEFLYIVSKKLFREKLKAERRSIARGTSVEFRDYRHYAGGDDFRSIDWNLFRRLDRLFIKLYEEEIEHNVTVLVDTSRSMQFGSPSKALYAKQVAAALGYISLANHDRVGLATFTNRVTGTLPPVRGKGQIWNVFHFLERAEADERATSLAEVCREVALSARRSGIVILITDFFDNRPNAIEEALRQLLSRKFDVYVLHVLEPGEAEPKLRGEINLVDSETGELREVSIDATTIARYKEAFAQYCAEIEAYCKGKGMVYLRSTTDVIFDELVLRIFREGGFLE